MSTDSGYHNLREALSQPGCPICRLKSQAADRFAESLLWEGVTDPERRQTLRESQGYCYEHASSLERVGASLGTAIISEDLLRRAIEAVDAARFEGQGRGALRRLRGWFGGRGDEGPNARLRRQIGPRAPCPACVWADNMERLFIEDLLKHLLGDGGLARELEASDGLCFAHLRRVLGLVQDAATYDALIAAQRAVWARLVGDLGEFIRKNDHRFRGEQVSMREGNAWLRAIAALAGARPGRER